MNRLKKYQERLASGENAIDIMNDMERDFDIPMMNNEEFNQKNPDVIELYKKVSNSRKF